MMDRRSFLKTAAAAAATCSHWAIGGERAGKKPNILFVLVDDLGWTDLACFGSDFYETPNIDALCAKGMKFTAAYAASSVCSPTRSSIMTGKFPARLSTTEYFGGPQPGRWRRNTKHLPARYVDRLIHKEVTLAEAMKQEGYATFFAGKWHLGPEAFWPEKQGFDVNKGGITRGGPYGGKKYFSPYGNPRLKDGPDGEHLPDRLAGETVDFIEAHKDAPFLAYLAFYSVHVPLMTRKDLKRKYLRKKLAMRKEAGERPAMAEERASKVKLIQDHAVYAGMVESVDLAVGKVSAALERLGLTDNTIIIFMSDNGGFSTSPRPRTATSNLPLRAGKGWLYEGGIREPMFIVWPGVAKAGSRCDVPVISTDFYPTMLEMVGARPRPAQHLDGVSLVPLLQGGKSVEREALYWHYPHYSPQGCAPSGAVRCGDWKLIEWYEDGAIELYNVRDDIEEKHNLAEKEPERAAELHEMLKKWRKETGARKSSPNPNFDPNKPIWPKRR